MCYTFKRCTFLNRTCIASNSPNCIGRDLALSMSLMCNPPTFVTRHVDLRDLGLSMSGRCCQRLLGKTCARNVKAWRTRISLILRHSHIASSEVLFKVLHLFCYRHSGYAGLLAQGIQQAIHQDFINLLGKKCVTPSSVAQPQSNMHRKQFTELLRA